MYLHFMSPPAPSVPFKAPVCLSGAGSGTLCEEVHQLQFLLYGYFCMEKHQQVTQ